jgi:hypothetical protein
VKARQRKGALDVAAEGRFPGDRGHTGWVDPGIIGPEGQNAFDVSARRRKGGPLCIPLQQSPAFAFEIHRDLTVGKEVEDTALLALAA